MHEREWPPPYPPRPTPPYCLTARKHQITHARCLRAVRSFHFRRPPCSARSRPIALARYLSFCDRFSIDMWQTWSKGASGDPPSLYTHWPSSAVDAFRAPVVLIVGECCGHPVFVAAPYTCFIDLSTVIVVHTTMCGTRPILCVLGTRNHVLSRNHAPCHLNIALFLRSEQIPFYQCARAFPLPTLTSANNAQEGVLVSDGLVTLGHRAVL
ncbi:hypothetical protein B0H14DRAFT_3540707 [Mycena olivaceomarginata]|nr:hypothetical protein B0H14DRAFT_3540707 [Mycena olivaceomarginata]